MHQITIACERNCSINNSKLVERDSEKNQVFHLYRLAVQSSGLVLFSQRNIHYDVMSILIYGGMFMGNYRTIRG